jgi:hypothetical protein
MTRRGVGQPHRKMPLAPSPAGGASERSQNAGCGEACQSRPDRLSRLTSGCSWCRWEQSHGKECDGSEHRAQPIPQLSGMASPTRNPAGKEGKCHEQKESDSKADHRVPRRVDHHANGEIGRYDNQKQQRSRASHLDRPLWFGCHLCTRFSPFLSRVNRRKDAGWIHYPRSRWVNEDRPQEAAYLTVVNSRRQRTDHGQFQMCQAGSPSLIEKKMICASPMRFSNGT